MQNYHWIFYLTFVSQIVLISYYIPSRMLGRMSFLLETYPPDRYAKLYPVAEAYYRIGFAAFRWANRVIFLIGFGVLAAIHRFGPMEDGTISEAWPAAYAMLQVLPMIGLEFLTCRQFALMRKSKGANVRKAELRPRRFFDLVSPTLLVVALVLFVGALVLDAYLLQEIRWPVIAGLTLGNLFMVSIGLWQFFGRKQDPYQNSEDRRRQLRAQWTSLLMVSIVMSIFYMTHSADQIFALDFLDAPLLSVYFQVVILLSLSYLMHSLKIEDIDFEVYRSSPTTT